MDAFSKLRPIFHPRAVALLGASSGEGKVGRMFMERFLEAGFERLYPDPRRAAISLAKLADYARFRDQGT